MLNGDRLTHISPYAAREYSATESGLLLPTIIIRKPKRPIAFDFFCGAGGMGCGIIQSGFEIVGANEFDPSAAITYMVNLGAYPMQIHYLDGEAGKEELDKCVAKSWGLKSKRDYDGEVKQETLQKVFGSEIASNRCCMAGSGWIKNTDYPGVRNFWFGDMRKLKGQDILNTLGLKQGNLDLVCGGPPCQGFSTSGKRQVGDPRNALVYEYARLIVELQPKTFIMEEVPNVVNFFDPDGVPVLDKFCLLLEEGGFGTWDMIKKSLLTQTGAAAVIKPKSRPSGKRKKPQKKTKPAAPPKAADATQISFEL